MIMKINRLNKVVMLRQEKGLTQKELANMIGFKPCRLNKIESSDDIKDVATYREIEILANVLDTTIADIITKLKIVNA